jgi:hypothetical protein
MISGWNLLQKEYEKKLKYRTVSLEIQRMWNVKCFVIPVTIGSTGIVTEGLKISLNNARKTADCVQKAAVLGTRT